MIRLWRSQKELRDELKLELEFFLEQLYQSYCLEKDVESDASLEIIGWSHSVLKWYNTHRPIKFWLIIGHIGKARNMDDKLQFKWIFSMTASIFSWKILLFFFFLFNFYNFWEHFDQYTLSWKKNCISHVPVQSLFSKKRMTKSFICIHQCIRNLLHVLSQFIKEIVDYTCK